MTSRKLSLWPTELQAPSRTQTLTEVTKNKAENMRVTLPYTRFPEA